MKFTLMLAVLMTTVVNCLAQNAVVMIPDKFSSFHRHIDHQLTDTLYARNMDDSGLPSAGYQYRYQDDTTHDNYLYEAIRFPLNDVTRGRKIKKVTLSIHSHFFTNHNGIDGFELSCYNLDAKYFDTTQYTAMQQWHSATSGLLYHRQQLYHASLDTAVIVAEFDTNDAIVADILDSLEYGSGAISFAFEVTLTYPLTYPTIRYYHIAFFPRRAWVADSYQEGDITLRIEYLPNTAYLNDFKRSHHGYVSGDSVSYFEDFISVSPDTVTWYRDHGEGDYWEKDEEWDLLMHPHDSVAFTSAERVSADGLQYNREPRVWTKEPEGGTPVDNTVPGAVWENAKIDTMTTFTANFYRLVNNEFGLYNLVPGFAGGSPTQIASGDRIDEFIVDNQLGEYEYIVYQRRDHETADEFEVTVPLTIGSGTDTKYFLVWDPDDGGMKANTAIDAQSMTATTTIEPDLHHMDSSYANPYKAYYAQIKAYDIENHTDITTEIMDLAPNGNIVVGFDAAEKAWELTVPKEYTDANGDTYYFVGWWDDAPPSPLT